MRRALLLVVALGCSKSESGPAKHEDRGHAQDRATTFSLAVTIGEKHETWTPETFAKVAHSASKNSSGNDRDTWSLRELAKLAGPTARVTRIVGEGGAKDIDAAAWADPARVPILHSTRRGTLKFRWAAPDGTWGVPEVSDVNALELAP